MTVGCGITYKRTNLQSEQGIQNYYSSKYINILYAVLWIIFTHKNSSRDKKYLLNATLVCSFSFLRLVRLHCKLLKIVTPVYYVPFIKHKPFYDFSRIC